MDLDCWTIMPNHVHGIIILAVGAGYESRLEWRWHADMGFDFKSGDGWGVNRVVGGILTAPYSIVHVGVHQMRARVSGNTPLVFSPR